MSNFLRDKKVSELKKKLYLYNFRGRDLAWTSYLNSVCRVELVEKLSALKNKINDCPNSILITKACDFYKFDEIIKAGINPYKIVALGPSSSSDEIEEIINLKILDWIFEFRNEYEAKLKIILLFNKLNLLNELHSLSKLKSSFENLKLTQKEERLLHFIMTNKRACKEEIYTNIWKEDNVTKKTIDVHLYNLRKKLKTINMQIIKNKNGTLEVA